jgi:hypothetical protein
MDWQDYKVRNTNIEGARAAFEKDCATLFNTIYPDKNVKTVKVSQGDGGIDVFIGNIGIEPITVIQCKFFLEEFGNSQQQQIRESFKTAIISSDYEMKEWILCIPRIFDLKQSIWWSKWLDKTRLTYSLDHGFINLKDGNDLINLFKEHKLFNKVFKLEDSLKLNTIDKKIDDISNKAFNIIPLEDAKIELEKANFYLEHAPHFFGENIETHIEREETQKIYNWIKNVLKANEKNVFILEGEKGYGKTVVLKDLLLKLKKDEIDVLGIKADKYFAADRIELEKKIFQKENISIEAIAKLYNDKNKNLVIIVDQLDALSQSLSSNREYIQTYIRLIADLSYNKNIRIIISTRSYDLNYDAELSIYKSDKYSKVKIASISKEKVKEVLSKYGINNTSEKLLELLTVPNHLDIFCKLPNKQKLNLHSLTSLKDLYDSLWKQLISSKEGLDLKSILYKIADKMYEDQQITIKNIFDNENFKEINYLKSNHLLVDNNNELQFFHQTFYDYTFSRQFVENRKSLEKYIQENNQSLYVRSSIKMVVEYFREYNPKEYSKIISQLIKSSKYRFHIKTLVITSLGEVNNPSEDEKVIVSKLILTNFKYTEIFISSIFSKGWLAFILNKNIPLTYFTYEKKWKNNLYENLITKKIIKPENALKYNYAKQKDIRLNLILRLYINNTYKGLDLIMDYFDKVPDFSEKQYFINRFLTNVKEWENSKLLELFDTYFPFIQSDKKKDYFWHYQILEKIFKKHPEYVFEKLKPIILKCFDENSFTIKFSHDQVSLFDKINEFNPDGTFIFFFMIFDEIIQDSMYTGSYYEINSPLYRSSKFSELFESEIKENAGDFIENLLSEYIKSKATDKKYLKDFFKENSKSNSVPHLKILILGLSEIPLFYKNEIFELINIIYVKNGFNGIDDKFQLYLRNLISKIFYIYSQDDKLKIAQILLSIKHPADFYFYTDANNKRKPVLSFYGKKKYLFIDALPKEEVYAIPILKKAHQELERKFGEVNEKQLDGSNFSCRCVGPPLSSKAYKKMNNADWKNSILLFGDDYQEDRFSGDSKGGKLEHSRSFEEEVSNDANRFYPLIIELFETENISVDYLFSGISGLIKVKYDVLKVKELYLKLINGNLNQTNTLYSVWNVDYFIENKVIDLEILNYLANLALNHPNPEKPFNPNDPLHDSLNSVRGAAIHKLIKCSYNPAFTEIIFSTAEQVINDPQLSVRVAVLVKLAFLNHLDLDRAFKIFIKLTDTDDLILLKNSFLAASYLKNTFYQEMKPLFNKIIDNEELHNNGSVLIVHSYLLGYDKKKEYYNRLISKGKTARLKSIHIAEKNLFKDGILDNKCIEILFQFLDEKEDDFASSYSGLILRKFNSSNFKVLFSFMKVYAKSDLFQKDPRYFLKYLLKNAKDYPIECLELVKSMKFDRVPNIQDRGHYDTEPVQLVLSIYSSLNNNFKDNKKQIEQVLVIFDEMLKLEHLRLSSNKAIDTLK